MDDTAKIANIKASVKKYFVDNIEDTEGVTVVFDKDLSDPDLHSKDSPTIKWVVVIFDPIDRSEGDMNLRVLCCTRRDAEGFRLAQTHDTVYKYLQDTDKTDGMARIPLYAISGSSLVAQDKGMVVIVEGASDEFEADDDTKFLIINVRLRWGVKF